MESFLVAGIGASAGGIQALKVFFEATPANSGIAYVVILHLSPDHDSQLAEVLQASTGMPVTQVKKKTHLQPDQVYVIPPDKHLKVKDGFIHVTANTELAERRAPVDIFFRSLAEAYDGRAIGVILSGTGANGSMGLKRIKECGGAVFVQNPREAQFNEMPRNAIATNLTDEILNVADIPSKIIAYRNSLGSLHIPEESKDQDDTDQKALRTILAELRLRTGHDFTNYKRPTLMRRIERRVHVRERADLPNYAAFIVKHPEETQSLLKDLLISVTNFFRDKKPFEELERNVLPKILERKNAEDQLRIWVAGCATGEEAYSIAMICADLTLGMVDAPKIQIFATDIDEVAIATAREGFYTLNDAADVSQERLNRYFTKEGNGYRIRRELREIVLFANHNFIKDSPFSRIDMVSCRNVLIYLNRLAQDRVMETFHFALKTGGFLVLGSSESVDIASNFFGVYSREHHMWQSRQVVSKNFIVPEGIPKMELPKLPTKADVQPRTNERKSFGELHHQMVEQYAPPSLVVNEEFDIVHTSEKAVRYLTFVAGEPTPNLLKTVRQELRAELRSALYQALQRKTNVSALGLNLRLDNHTETLNIHVRPLPEESSVPMHGFMLVIFEPAVRDEQKTPVILSSDEPASVHLEEEVVRLKGQLRVSNEQHEFTSEELKAGNEELQAMNEELRSATEELETSKEELQSMNEELSTVNQELKVKVEEATMMSNNLQNLINSTDIGTIFLDRSLRVVLFTPTTRSVYNLIPADFGRPLSDITSRLEENTILEDAHTVLEQLQRIEREARTIDGHTMLVRLSPYRSEDDRIKGVVISLLDITERKRAHEAIKISEEKYRTLFDSIDEGFCIIEMIYDDNGTPVDFRYMEANDGFERQTGRKPHAGQTMRELFPETQDMWLETYAEVVRTGSPVRFVGYNKGLNRWYNVYAFPTNASKEKKQLAALFSDVTDKKRAELAVEEDLRCTQILHTLASQSIVDGDIQVLYDKVLDAAIELTRADSGTIQLYEESTQELVFLSAKNIPAAMIKKFERVDAASKTPCGVALVTGDRAFVDYDTKDALDDDSLKIHLDHGFYSGQSTPLISRSGKPIGMFSTHWKNHHRPNERELRFLDILSRQAADLIEQRQSAQALRESERKLKQLLRQRDEFIGVASHELKTPITSMKTYAEIVQGRLDEIGAANDSELVSKLNKQIDRLNSLINLLLDTTKISEGQLLLNKEQFDINELINERTSEIKRASDHTFDLQLQDAPQVIANRERIGQVMINLLSNAIKYSPKGTTITVTSIAGKDGVTVNVQDEGFGIPEQDIEKLFDKFFRVTVNHRDTFPGMGLGLYVTAEIIRKHNGTISVKSTEGKGSVFSFTLPYS